MASVRYRSNGLYEIRFYDGTRSSQKSKSIYIKASGKRSAQAIAMKLEEQRSLGQYNPWVDLHPTSTSTQWTAGEALKKYIGYIEGELRAKTVKEKKYVLNKWIDFLGPQAQLDEQIEKKTNTFIGRLDISHTSKNTYSRVIQTFLHWTERQGYSSTKLSVEIPDVPQKEVTFLNELDMWLIADNIKPRWMSRVVRFAFYSGARLSEIEHIRHCDVNLKGEIGYIRIGREGFTAKTKHSFRTIPVTPPILETFEDLWIPQSTRPLFGHTYYPRVSKSFRSIRKSMFPDRDIHFHCLRHSCAVYYLSGGMSIYQVSKLLGHSSSSVTEKYYADLIPSSLRNSMVQVHNVSA